MYLRKSRADLEAESRGEGETLARHQNMLTELAERQNLDIVKVYKEIVSGESIAARPQMQALLTDVSEGRYAGVLVVEIERLARGDTIDQGIVAQAFRESSTKIVTPSKTYDPNNEFDEEYFEFSLFMSRREYKTIKRRMQAGRLASVKEGNYIGTSAPYGYRKTNPSPKVHTLEVVASEAEAVRLIYKHYLDGMGAGAIAAELDRMGISPQKSRSWGTASIKKILSNPVYCGKLGWKTKDGEDMLYDGIHEPIISEELFKAVQERKRTYPAAKLRTNDRLLNYYHNILFCQHCGHQLKRRYIASSGREYMLCVQSECRGVTVSSPTEAVDEAVVAALRYRIKQLGKLKIERCAASVKAPDKKVLLAAELERAEKQLSRLHVLLEQEVYDADTFLERSAIVKDRINTVKDAMQKLDSDNEKKPVMNEDTVKRLVDVIESFSAANPTEKNRLIQTVVKRIYYSKTRRMDRKDIYSNLTLTVDFV